MTWKCVNAEFLLGRVWRRANIFSLLQVLIYILQMRTQLLPQLVVKVLCDNWQKIKVLLMMGSCDSNCLPYTTCHFTRNDVIRFYPLKSITQWIVCLDQYFAKKTYLLKVDKNIIVLKKSEILKNLHITKQANKLVEKKKKKPYPHTLTY